MNQFLFRSSRITQTLLAWLGLQLVLMLAGVTAAQAQGGTVNVAASCPESCGLRINITSAKLRERADGIDAVVSWTVTQPAPEVKLTGFAVTAFVEYKGVGKDEGTVGTKADERQTVVKLQSGGFNKDIKFSDIAIFRVKVLARTEPVPSINVTDLNSIRIVGEGGDSAVDVSWRAPNPMPCSASTFLVKVKAINEKGDRLEGEAQAAITARTLRVQLKGDLNKKGLRNPEATVKLLNSIVSCERFQSFQPTQEGLSGGVGSTAPNPEVTLKSISFQSDGDRVETTIPWDVVEPSGFRATRFEVKVDTEFNDGRVDTVTRTATGSERSVRGGDARANNLRSVTATIKATFSNNSNTTVLFREDTQTDKFSAKAALLDTKKPVPPQGQAPNIGLSAEVAKIVSENNAHTVTVKFQAKPPAGITVTGFIVEATAQGNQNSATRSATVLGQTTIIGLQFPFSELGSKLIKVQVKVTATAQRANGSTFQQTATAEGQPVVPPPPPPPPPALLKVKTLNAIGSGNNFFVRGSWFIELQPGITVQDFIVEAAVLKPTGPIRKTVNVGGAVREQSVTFTTAEANGATAVEMKVTANLRRADGTTFQETSVRQAAP